MISVHSFQFKTKPEGKERASEFLNEGYICIGWSKVADMTSLTKEDIRKALTSELIILQVIIDKLRYTFRNIIREGEVVLITQDGFNQEPTENKDKNQEKLLSRLERI